VVGGRRSVERQDHPRDPAVELRRELLGALVGERERVGGAGQPLHVGAAESQRGGVEDGSAPLRGHAGEALERWRGARGDR